MTNKIEDPRREFLVKALGLGLFSLGGTMISTRSLAMGDIPDKLPPGRSIYKLQGNVYVNGLEADIETRIDAGSTVKTLSNSSVIFAVGTDAFILRSNSELQITGDNFVINQLRVISGKLLSVFGRRETSHRISTATATIGIRGTGIYVESEPDQSYVCVCYGKTLISSVDDPNVSQEIISRHHDKPVYVLPKNSGELIRSAPFVNHTDSELALIEELVGRVPPFAVSGAGYDAPRKRTY